ncbi:amidase, partial [Streptomyces sviceus ATCC 29083]
MLCASPGAGCAAAVGPRNRRSRAGAVPAKRFPTLPFGRQRRPGVPEVPRMTYDRSAGLVETAGALADGTITSRALVEQTLARIQSSQGTLNAFRIVRTHSALAEADAADAQLAAGVRKPLLGVPVAVKDDMDVAGEPTAFGCQGEFPAVARDGEAVRRLRAAGAVIVGKTNTCEFGQWPFTEGPAFGATRNPWSPEHTPGGSSGGSRRGRRRGSRARRARLGRGRFGTDPR